ncbi:MAG: tetratricopeptide repeat protein [Bacteroidaceae bacterium]|nr:tetratricopeptide repeat protein [Bacteroidaceae bacterium]
MKTILSFTLLFIALAIKAQNYNEICQKGIGHIKENDYAQAAVYFEQAVAYSSNNNEKIYALANLAYSYQMQNELQKALKEYDKALEVAPSELTLLQQRANIYLRLDSTARALEDYNRLLQHEPSNTGALLCRAHIYTNTEQFDKAWEDYKRLQMWIPDNLSVRLGIAMLYQKEKRYDESLLVLSAMIEENAGIAELYIARSNLERERGHNELAMMDLEKAIELDPDNANNYILQAIIYEKMGKKDAARKCRKKATELGAGQNAVGL